MIFSQQIKTEKKGEKEKIIDAEIIEEEKF